ncbi:MAG: GMC family oxidoreductase [Myxococcota bacterium]
MDDTHYDWVIVGSGFGGSVSAHRLAEKGYRVLVLEKGRRYEAKDFPKTNWDLKRWMWNPALGLKGIFQMTFLKHMTVLHGVGVGGGSLVYANTLPTPKRAFFEQGSWSGLADWESELAPHYAEAKRMLGAAPNPVVTRGDKIIRDIAKDIGREAHMHPTDVAVYFGKAGETAPDPYFDGKGPERTGCTHCGACMTGCRVGAKNTLDKNYLYFAEQNGAEVRAETEVTAVRPRGDGGSAAGGYVVETRPTFGKGQGRVTADRVIFAGGVMGTLPLLLRMQEDPEGLPKLSARLGDFVRSNSEALIAIIAPKKGTNFSKGVAITSILHTDEHSHLEPVRYGPGSGFFRLLMAPHAPGATVLGRVWGGLRAFARHPLRWLRAFAVPDMAQHSQVLLYMRTLEGSLRMRLGRGWRSGYRRTLVTEVDDPSLAPSAFMEEATDLAERFAEKTDGVAATLTTETLLGVPSTAHILGGACMGATAADGVIDAQHRVHGYPGLYVIDGSAISANPGVNPSLTIATLAERAMSLVAAKHLERAPSAERETAATPRARAAV